MAFKIVYPHAIQSYLSSFTGSDLLTGEESIILLLFKSELWSEFDDFSSFFPGWGYENAEIIGTNVRLASFGSSGDSDKLVFNFWLRMGLSSLN